MTGPGEWAWLRWARVPWQEWSLAAALVAATAAPVLLVVSADAWRAAAEESISERVLEGLDLERNGIDVTAEVAFGTDSIGTADEEVTSRLAAIGEVARPDLSLYTLTGLLSIGPPVRTVGPPGRLFARSGALEAIEIVDEADDTQGGVWITDDFATRNALTVGDGLAFEAGAIADEEWNDLVQGGGTNSVFRIVGIYEALWSAEDGERTGYWSEVPPEVVPRYIPAFGGPSSELVITDADTLLASGLTGVARWRAPLTAAPDGHDQLLDLRREVRSFDGALVGTGELGTAMLDVQTPEGRRPILATDLYRTTGVVEAATSRLDEPLTSARSVGVIVALAASLAAGALFVDRRRSDFRLLAAEGVRPFGMAVRVGAQLLAPAALGAALGVTAAMIGARAFGHAGALGLGDVPWGPAVVTALASLVIAAMSAGAVGGRALSPLEPRVVRAIGATLASVLLVAAALAWFQVRRDASDDGGGRSVDLVATTFPVLAVLVVVVLVLFVATRLLGLLGSITARRGPVEVFLAFRRLASGSGGVRLAAGTLGLGIGLLVFSLALRSTLDRTAEVKLATEIGAVTAANLIDDLPDDFEPPGPTTVIRTFDTVVSPGGGRLRVIAVDPDEYLAVVDWPDQFGADPDRVVDILTSRVTDRVPAVGVRGERAPAEGAFGLGESFPYRIVDRIGAFPGAGDRDATILVSADALDLLAFERDGHETAAAAADAGAEPLTDRFRRRLMSQADAGELVAALDAADVRYRDVVTIDERRDDPDRTATRWAFGFLGVLGVVAALGALVSLAMFLAARRRARALTGVMVRAMGLAPGRSALVAVIEVVTICVLAVVAAVAAATVSVGRLLPRFDPAPDVPPAVPVLMPWAPILAASILGMLVLGTAVWSAERRGAARPEGRVIRENS